MTEFIGLLKELDVNNAFWLFIISIALIVVIAGYMQVFMASGVENVLMSKGDEVKKLSVAYVIFFLFFSVLNYLFTLNISLLVSCLTILGLVLLVKIIFSIVKKGSKGKKTFPEFEEKIMLYSMMSFFPVATYVIQDISGINQLSSAILCALIETVLIGFLFLNMSERVSSIVIKNDGQKWYVFKRIDENYLLCGDNKQINSSVEMVIFSLEDIVEKGMKLEKDIE